MGRNFYASENTVNETAKSSEIMKYTNYMAVALIVPMSISHDRTS